MYHTNMYEGMLAETITMRGAKGDVINAYYARPLGPGPFPGMVAIHHAPGWDEWYREATRKFAHHGYAAISPNLYFRDGHGTPEDVGAQGRSAMLKGPCGTCARFRTSTARWVSSAPVRGADTRFSSRVV